MAKKDYNVDPWSDFEDFEELEFGDGMGGFKSTTKTGKAREAVTALTGGFISGIKKSMFERTSYQRLVSQALPSEYSSTLDSTLEFKDNVEYLYDTARREGDAVTDKFTRGVKPFVDRYNDKIPRKIAAPLRRWTSKVGPTNVWTAENKEELDTVATLNDIFSKRDQTKNIKETALHAKVTTSLTGDNLNLTRRLVLQQNQMLAYQDQVDLAWKRKTLELQYKQYLVQRQTLDAHQQLLKLSHVSFTNIIKNTGLPEIKKMQNSELAGQVVRTRLYGAAVDSFASNSSRLMSQMVNNAVKKIRSGSQDMQQSTSEWLSQLYEGATIGSELTETMGAEGSTREAGSIAGEYTGNRIAKYVGKKLKPKLEGNVHVKRGADILASTNSRLPRILNEYLSNGDTGNSFIDMLIELTGANTMIGRNSTQVMSNHAQELDSAMYFDLITKKSITEIIPGYLSRIHHEIRTLRTGNADAPLLDFDFEKGTFSDLNRISDTLRNRTVGSRNAQALATIHGELTESLGLDGIKSDDTRRELLKQFSMAGVSGQDFSVKKLLKSSTFDERQLNELREFFSDQFNINLEDDEQIDVGLFKRVKAQLTEFSKQSPEAAKAQRTLVNALDRQQLDLANPLKALVNAAASGKITSVMRTGIVNEDGGRYSVDYEKYIDKLMAYDLGQTDDSGDFEREDKSPDRTPTRRFIDDATRAITDRTRRLLPPPPDADPVPDEPDDPDGNGGGGSPRPRLSLRERRRLVSERLKEHRRRIQDSDPLDNVRGRFNASRDKINNDERVKNAKTKVTDVISDLTQNEKVVAARTTANAHIEQLSDNQYVIDAKIKAQAIIDDAKRRASEAQATRDTLAAESAKIRKELDEYLLEVTNSANALLTGTRGKISELRTPEGRAATADKISANVQQLSQRARDVDTESIKSRAFTRVKETTNGITSQVKKFAENVNDQSNDSIPKINIARAAQETERLKNLLKTQRWTQLNNKHGDNDTIARLMETARNLAGKDQVTDNDILKLYDINSTFREVVDEATKTVSDKTRGVKAKTVQLSSRAKAHVHDAINRVSQKIKDNRDDVDDVPDEPTHEDIEAAKQYADDFIADNNIDDPKGGVKESIFKAYLADKFKNSRVYQPVDRVARGTSTLYRKGTRVAKYVTSDDSAIVGAVKLMWDVSRFAGRAAEIATRPHRAALKLIPWGMKTLAAAMIDATDFDHVEHALWLKGEREPRLTKTGLSNGRYVNGEGDVIVKPKDIIGNIYDTMTTPASLVMVPSEYKSGLYDSTGKLIYKPLGIIKRARNALFKLPVTLTKLAAKVTKKVVLGYLNITTKPVTWLINRIMRDDTIDPKLHAELVQLGLTEQTNQKIDELTKAVTAQHADEDKEVKFNDKDGDGERDGGFKDTALKHEERRTRRDAAKRESQEKRGFFSRKKKDKTDDDEDNDGMFSKLLGGRGMGMMGRLAGVARNPYVLTGIALASLLGYEALNDGRKSQDADDIANVALPESLQDNKAARLGIRVAETIVDGIFLKHFRGMLTIAAKTREIVARVGNYTERKVRRAGEDTGQMLAGIPSKTIGLLLGTKAERFFDKLVGRDNLSPLFNFRMAQYGFELDDKESVTAVLKLEADILASLVEATDKAPARIGDGITIEQSAAYFNVSINSEENLAEWITWFSTRFRPVFLSCVTVLKRLGFSGKQLHNADTVLGKKKKLEYISKTNFFRENHNPYEVSVSPVGAATRLDVVGVGTVEEIRKLQIAEIELMPDDAAKLRDNHVKSAKRDKNRIDKALVQHADTKVDKRNDVYAKIDKLTFKNGMKFLTGNPDTVNNPKFSGAGAGADYSTVNKSTPPPVIDMNDKGIIGNSLSAIGGLFINQAHASNFVPELQNPHNTSVPLKAASARDNTGLGAIDGSSSLAPTKATVLAPPVYSGVFKANTTDGTIRFSSTDKPLKAAAHARLIARVSSGGFATRHVREALTKAGYIFKSVASATNYPAQVLPHIGFSKISNDTSYQAGDIMVFAASKDYRQGHIQIFDGANWISDYVQEEMIPFTKGVVPHYTLWRDMKFKPAGNVGDAQSKKAIKTKLSDANASRGGAVKVAKAERPKTAVQKVWDKIREAGINAGAKVKDVTTSIKEAVSSAMGNLSQSASNAYSGAGDAVSNAVASMTGSQKEWQLRVYKAFKTAGFSEQHARILTAEIGRENSYNPKYMFGGHADPHKGSNLGMLSWQGTRKPKLIAFLREAGVIDGANKMVAGQEALDAQARFIMWELKNTHAGVGNVFLSKPNISYAEGAYLIGKRYILWRIDDPKYAAKGKQNRDGFYNMLLKQLGSSDATQTASTPKAVAKTALAATTKAKATPSSARPGVTAASLAANTMGTVPTPKAGTATAPTATKANSAAVVNKNIDPKASTDSAPKATANTAVAGNTAPAKAAQLARRGAAARSQGRCARFVRLALQGAGYVFTGVPSAYMYANGTLSSAGFGRISTATTWQVGDVVVIDRLAGHPHGHICIWDGRNWISDFVQNNWNVYSRQTVSWTLWRDRRYLNGAAASAGPTSSSAGTTGGAAGSGVTQSAPPKPEYKTVKMKYNEYGADYDAAIKKNWQDGTKFKFTMPQAQEDKDPSVKAATANVAGSGVLKPTSTAPTVTNKPTTTVPVKPTVNGKPAPVKSEVKSPVANNLAPVIKEETNTWTPDLSFGNRFQSQMVKPRFDIDSTHQVREAKAAAELNKNLTKLMSEREAKRVNDDIASSNTTLRESLYVQKMMLEKLTSMDGHLSAIVRGQKTRQITDSSDTSGVTETPVTTPASTRVTHNAKRAGRDVPMSMSKNI